MHSLTTVILHFYRMGNYTNQQQKALVQLQVAKGSSLVFYSLAIKDGKILYTLLITPRHKNIKKE